MQTSLQIPREARGSRTSAIVLSVVVHVALVVGIRHWVWQPRVHGDMPIFNVFQLTPALEEVSPLIVAPPVVAEADPAIDVPPLTQPDAPAPAAPTTADAPFLPVPSDRIPQSIPEPGAAIREPTGLQPPRTPAERLLRSGGATSGLLPRGNDMSVPLTLTPEELAAGRLFAGMKQYNDSVAAAKADADRATDWTVKGKDGDRWGVSPGQLHLGSVTIPLPFSFSGPTGRRDEVNARVRNYAEIDAQARRLELEHTFESRVKALRARKDAQRDSARSARTGNL